VGNRDSETLNPLFERLKQNFDPEYFASDDYVVYHNILPSEQHAVGKDLTYNTEQHNSDTRHWLARFRRKSKVVSHCKKMVRLCLIAVEHVFKGGGLEKLTGQLTSIF
jgi:insertion element IS1 protein InsB